MGPALPYVCLFCKFNVLRSILPCSIETGGPNRGGVPAGSAVRGFVLQLLCLAFWSLPSVRVGIDCREHLYLYYNTAGPVAHWLGVVREFRRPNPPRMALCATPGGTTRPCCLLSVWLGTSLSATDFATPP